MFVDIGRTLPQEFTSKELCLRWYKNKQLGLRNSLRLLSKERESMMIRTPITNENTIVYGTRDEISWLHLELEK